MACFKVSSALLRAGERVRTSAKAMLENRPAPVVPARRAAALTSDTRRTLDCPFVQIVGRRHDLEEVGEAPDTPRVQPQQAAHCGGCGIRPPTARGCLMWRGFWASRFPLVKQSLTAKGAWLCPACAQLRPGFPVALPATSTIASLLVVLDPTGFERCNTRSPIK